MSNMHDEINDDEIRIITSNNASNMPPADDMPEKPVTNVMPQLSSCRAPRSFKLDADGPDFSDDDFDDRPVKSYRQSKKSSGSCLVLLILFGVAFMALLCWFTCSRDEETCPIEPDVVPLAADSVANVVAEPAHEAKYVTARDTVVAGTTLRILTPYGATPRLVIGKEALADSSAVLVAQAADVRGDNGRIAGAYVMQGDLLSRGAAKAGFCAIINGEITVGVADATPMLEQAIESEGYFFRQFPLVVGGQVVENKPKGRSQRKALAEIDGHICVILSLDRLTFHDFSQALADAGVRNAIYLVGSTAEGRYVDESGTRYTFGTPSDTDWEYLNYIVWK